jgi:hypothetical protein
MSVRSPSRLRSNIIAEKTTYVYEDNNHHTDHHNDHHSEAPPPPQEFYPPPPPSVMHAPPPPPAAVYHAPPPPASVYAPSVRHPSPPRQHEEYVEIERSAAIHGPATSFLPESRMLVRRDDRHDYRSERDIKDEIKSLEDERRMLKYERETDYEFIERNPKREVVRVDKDRKGRLALVRSAR